METGAPGVGGQGTPVQERNSWKFGAHPSIGPISDTKTMTRNWGGGGLCPGDTSYPTLPSLTLLTSPRFPGGRGSKTHRLAARLNHSPPRERPNDPMLPQSMAQTPPPDVSQPSANCGRHLSRGGH